MFLLVTETTNEQVYKTIIITVIKLATLVEGVPKVPFSIATTLRCRDLYLIMLSVKQGGIKYHFLSLWYDSTWD